MSKYADLHLHSMDLFDSDNKPEAVCKRMKELGAKGFALTQHGVLSGIDSMRDACEEYGLKFIPGIEAYYGEDGDLRRNKHLILLSKSYEGYKAIWKAVSDSQTTDGYAVMNEEILKKYFGEGTPGHGQVYATSACINGVIAAVYRINETVDKEIQKAKNKLGKTNVDTGRLDALQKTIAEVEAKLSEAKDRQKTLKALAATKTLKIERYVEKLRVSNDPAYAVEKEALDEKRRMIKNAEDSIPEAASAVKKLSLSLSTYNKEYNALVEKVNAYNASLANVRKIEAMRKSDEEVESMLIAETQKFLNIFGEGNFYMEIQNHGIDVEEHVYPKLVSVARKLGVPLVASNDVHTISNSEEELLRRRIMRALRFGKWEQDNVGDDELYIKTDEQLKDWLLRIFPLDVVEEAMGNIKVIFDSCNVEFEKGTHYPTFPLEPGETAISRLKKEIRKGAQWRFPNGMDEAHKQRVNREFEVIRDMGYADYHLVVKDFLEYGRALGPVPTDKIEEAPFDIEELNDWVKANGWEVGFTIGPGRGSGVGSLICYLLGITNLDPLDYDLLFERFLNRERVSMPDIDSDIANRIRPKVIQYVQHKYGENAVCGIMTTNAQAPRGCIRIAAKYFLQYRIASGAYPEVLKERATLESMNPAQKRQYLKNRSTKEEILERQFLRLADQMAKKVPQEPNISFASKANENGDTVFEALSNEFVNDKNALQILVWAKSIEGIFTAYGAHAAGIVISDNGDVREYLPLRWNKKLSEWTTQSDMNHIEAKGLIKMDVRNVR